MARVDSSNGQRITIKIMITITTKNGRVSREAVNGYETGSVFDSVTAFASEDPRSGTLSFELGSRLLRDHSAAGH